MVYNDINLNPEPEKVEEEFYSIKDLTSMFKVKYDTIRDWLKSGKFPFYRIGQQIRIKKSDLNVYLETCKGKPDPHPWNVHNFDDYKKRERIEDISIQSSNISS